MEILGIVLLGIIQGITEWLPISSTGHLLIFDAIYPLNLSPDFKSVFMVVVQLGSVFSVLVLYWNKLWPIKKVRAESVKAFKLWLKVLIATVPAAIAGLLFDDYIDSKLSVWPVIAAALAVYGALYIFIEKKLKLKARVNSVYDISIKDAIALGCFQMLALIPGTSRSGSTILGAMLIGLARPAAAEFSFFMSIPVMAGASLLRIVKHGLGFSGVEWLYLILGTLIAFAVSLFVIRRLVSYVQRHDFTLFGIYRIALALVITAYFLLS